MKTLLLLTALTIGGFFVSCSTAADDAYSYSILPLELQKQVDRGALCYEAFKATNETYRQQVIFASFKWYSNDASTGFMYKITQFDGYDGISTDYVDYCREVTTRLIAIPEIKAVADALGADWVETEQ